MGTAVTHHPANPRQVRQLASLLTNLVSACAIVFVNKAVLSGVHFRFTVALTCIHTVATWLTSCVLCNLGIIVRKQLPKRAVASLAGAFAGYIVLCNVSLQRNTVGFYQLTKIMIAPTVLVMGAIAHRRAPSLSVALCVMVVSVGIGLATAFDTQVMTNLPGLVVGLLSVVVSAQYGTWIGSMTEQHDVTSMQLLEQYLPYASLMMLICVPVESMLLGDTTVLTFNYTPLAGGLIILSTLLGVLVTFSTFLVIGNTSPLTYAVAGHAKTIAIIGGGVIFFGDHISGIKGAGLALAMTGVIAYTRVSMVASKTLADGGDARKDPREQHRQQDPNSLKR